ncbi:LysM peptidoglycan-binding domain-containing protein [Periweissella cryptocerci]|uniref:LysM peptidoglycan-binding domain-containing protein n=1 Tax=Periweissella cryptocerci TaxID=2506420 RepID=A0A4P6YWS1_9LACO|nr:LysM peptidoglycan-binding domain-containing protein [Periweissella cryptocerci]QBO37284.1 LysM peptidoglycan-binding domain-containing protein [Periweissella cryptocerci]
MGQLKYTTTSKVCVKKARYKKNKKGKYVLKKGKKILISKAVYKNQKKTHKIPFFALQESINEPNDSTSHSVDFGSPITDHIKEGDQTISLSGLFRDGHSKEFKTARDQYTKLKALKNKGTVFQWRGRIKRSSFIITNLTRSYEKLAPGKIEAQVELKHIRRVKLIWKSKKKKNSGKKQSSGGKNGAAVYVTVKKGNTYQGWALKYGTSLKQLRAWNKWKDNAIPVGKRARVK